MWAVRSVEDTEVIAGFKVYACRGQTAEGVPPLFVCKSCKVAEVTVKSVLVGPHIPCAFFDSNPAEGHLDTCSMFSEEKIHAKRCAAPSPEYRMPNFSIFGV